MLMRRLRAARFNGMSASGVWAAAGPSHAANENHCRSGPHR